MDLRSGVCPSWPMKELLHSRVHRQDFPITVRESSHVSKEFAMLAALSFFNDSLTSLCCLSWDVTASVSQKTSRRSRRKRSLSRGANTNSSLNCSVHSGVYLFQVALHTYSISVCLILYLASLLLKKLTNMYFLDNIFKTCPVVNNFTEY